ncbi:Lactose regulatory LAC9 [Hyphodiscus hymeniophilus]|uniref:Lactose regulatory LAC9 n=1 Tax=Hyphodiscus hymeniophilus TaxID=353542 RepID=A0A9P6VRF8_9HELO|nr:Lactose regulatory LAC9 [Hyphodiscus hymeniophilus]
MVDSLVVNASGADLPSHASTINIASETLDALSQALEECRTILKRLYPTRDVQTLLPLSRQQLISLVDRPGSQGARTNSSPSGSNTSLHSQDFQSATSDDDRSLANLEQIPSQDTEWDEERRNRDPIPAEADDVNALSLSVDRQSSYLGATSIKAAFLVMLRCDPSLKSFFVPSNASYKQQLSAGSNYPTPRTGGPVRPPQAIAWSSEGQTLIDAYFNRVQIIVPMLDEPSFRADYLNGRRQDAPWLALLNMVFTMGSIVANKSDNHSHIIYYSRAKEHLPIDTFGSGRLETLQALALMGGHYLHYINRPNMANAIIGAALRMACAMGLHREGPPASDQANQLIVEQRRRTWWTLFCLDTWASTTLGRPSMGRWGPAITIKAPKGASDHNVIGRHAGIIPLIENIKFCKITTEIQDLLAQSPVIRAEDRIKLDAQLVAWHDNLPWVLRSTDPCPESIYTARCLMKWQYQNIRIVLYRPVLLNLANRGAHGAQATNEDLAAVNTCRAIAKQAIEDISREWTPNQMLGWHGVWFMYQASMIPLVSMFWESWNTELVRECQQQIEIVIEAMDGLSDWSLAARRSREVLAKMYEASKRPPTRQPSPKLGVQLMPNGNGMNGHLQSIEGQSMGQLEMVDENGGLLDHQNIWDLDGMLWSDLPDGLELPFDGMPDMEFDEQGYDGNGFMMHQ